MPLMLTPAERAMLDSLAAPVDGARRPEFHRHRLSQARGRRTAAIGEGSIYRAARSVIARFLVGSSPIFVKDVSGPAGRATPRAA